MSPGLAQVLLGILQVLSWLVIARVVLSWFIRNPGHPLYRVVARLTDPLLLPFRRILTFGGIDLSPIAVLLLLRLAQSAVVSAAT